MKKEFLDNGQYTESSIMRYETIFGQNFISPGGKEIADQFINKLELRKHMMVLDIGCGLGGSALRMSGNFGVKVHGIDLSSNMIQIAQTRLEKEILKNRIKLKQGDCLKLSTCSRYNVVHSRDVFLHIKDKNLLFEVVKNTLIRKGRFGFSDYCLGLKHPRKEFLTYLKERKYFLLSVTDYVKLLKIMGFTNAHSEDKTSLFIKF